MHELNTFVARINHNWKLSLFILLGVLGIFALTQKFPNDDAYISYRYALNLANGDGMVWNLGQKLEAYSNFLWVIFIAIGFKIGLEPAASTTILGLLFFLASLGMVFRLAWNVLGSPTWGLLTTLMVGLSRPVFGFNFSGLETPLQLFLFTSVANIYYDAIHKSWTPKRESVLSLFLLLAILTRPDSIILIAMVLVGWFIFYSNKSRYGGAYLWGPLLIGTVIYGAWKMAYFGDLLPNSFYAKVQGSDFLGFGIRYVYLFITTHLLLPFLIIVAIDQLLSKKVDPFIRHIFFFVIVWIAYLIYVGGDFMEFRFFAPIGFMLLLLIFSAIKNLVSNRNGMIALVLGVVFANFHAWAVLPHSIEQFGVETIHGLRGHLESEAEDWRTVGKSLGQYFGGTDVVLALGAAGAIPYYSGLKTIDMIGICDKEVVAVAKPFTIVPGHRIITPLSHIIERGANLVIEPIFFHQSDAQLSRWSRMASWYDMSRYFMDIDEPIKGSPLNEVTLLVIPTKPGYQLITWYITPHPAIEQLIRDNNLRRIRLTRY